MNGPEDLPVLHEHIARGCARADRDPARFTLAALPIVCLDDDVALAKETVRRAVARYLGYDSYQRHASGLGYGAAVAQARERLAQGDAPGTAHAVPDELVERVGVYGQRERCLAQLESYRKAGADVVVISPRPTDRPGQPVDDPPEWQATYERVIAAFGTASVAT